MVVKNLNKRGSEKKRWSHVEEQFVRQNAGKLTDEEMVEKMRKIFSREVSLPSLRKKRQRMKIKKEGGRGRCSLA